MSIFIIGQQTEVYRYSQDQQALMERSFVKALAQKDAEQVIKENGPYQEGKIGGIPPAIKEKGTDHQPCNWKFCATGFSEQKKNCQRDRKKEKQEYVRIKEQLLCLEKN